MMLEDRFMTYRDLLSTLLKKLFDLKLSDRNLQNLSINQRSQLVSDAGLSFVDIA